MTPPPRCAPMSPPGPTAAMGRATPIWRITVWMRAPSACASGTTPPVSGDSVDQMAEVRTQAHHLARHWQDASAAPVRLGSDAHRALFCRMLLDTFNPYEPAVIDWPALSDDARRRLIALPIWDIAVQTEGKATRRVLSYAACVADPLLRRAIELNGFEEGRHKEVLAALTVEYGITLAEEPTYATPRDPEWAFMVTGYSECIDSF